MSASSQLPATTSAASTMQGGITPLDDIKLPGVPAVTGGAQNYANRMAATQSLTQLGSGNLAGGGYRKKRKTIYKRRYNNVTKVMKGCNGKRTRRHNKNKRHNKRVLRGGDNITPTIIDGKLELPVPLGASGGQVATLQELTGGLMALQTQAGNGPPSIPAPVQQNFSGGGITRHRSTKYRRLRYKKSIGRRGRSRRHSGGRH